MNSGIQGESKQCMLMWAFCSVAVGIGLELALVPTNSFKVSNKRKALLTRRIGDHHANSPRLGAGCSYLSGFIDWEKMSLGIMLVYIEARARCKLEHSQMQTPCYSVERTALPPPSFTIYAVNSSCAIQFILCSITKQELIQLVPRHAK